jgi:predicted transposase YbfD/YdcC
MLNLIEKLKQVKEFRKSKGKRHPLWLILLIIILGTMQGYLGYRALGDFAKANQKSMSQEFSILSGKMPCYSTIRRVIIGVDWENLLKIFNEWAYLEYGDRSDINWLAVDGKSIKSTLENYDNSQQNFVMFVSLFSQESGLVLHLKRFENKKGSEIGQVQHTVRDCGLENKVFTGDALQCQKETIELINESNNDYVIAVKKNQKNLYKKLELISKQEALLSCDIEKDKSHGRNIERKVSVFEFPENERNGWKNLQRVIKVERSGNRGEKNYQETAYYISSCLKEAEVFAKIIKGHWKIENQLHWVKDVILVEDKGKISQFQAATNFSILKTIGLNLFRSSGFISITEGQRWLACQWERLMILLA